ncbi:AarF/UbiB family protein, partial [Anoxybacillus sp. LAT27]
HHYVQTMLDGHYHADAHGSNIMIDKRTKKAVIIDWGMTGRMDSIMAQILMRVILHIQLNQAEDAAEVFMELMSPTIYTDVTKLKDELRTL